MTLHNEETTNAFLTLMTTKVKNRKYQHEDIENLLQLADSLSMAVRFERTRYKSGLELISNLSHIKKVCDDSIRG